ncbi:hypothetical protein CFC21_060605 [Triticum aestivum]|uniref:Nucleotide-diphospho-sugar transferase domain-containing protein n=2 Tax=Triticum aestivum TaxID=4565 RepID=A0A3B6JEW7_WHEAT|nr:hypothetical protein CFC21_060605 [Triticum aestivum]
MVIGQKNAEGSIQRSCLPRLLCAREQYSALLLFVAVAAVCLLVVVGSGTYALSSPADVGGEMEQRFFNIFPRQAAAGASDDELEAALRGAADANRTLIVSVLNKAYAEEGGLLDLFIESLKQGEGTGHLIGHVLLVAMDEPAFRRCSGLGGVRCYLLPPAAATNSTNLSSEQLYMSGGFIRMMWRRIRLLGDILKHGYSFIFTDMDVMWLRNPFPSLNRTEEEDLLISTDGFKGRPEDYLGHELNTRFFFVAASNRTAAMFDEWHAAREASEGMKEQDVLNQMKQQGAFRRLGVRVRVLDTARFSGFCQDSQDARQVVTVHANCCRTMRAKVADLKAVLGAAKQLNGTTGRLKWPRHSACLGSWRK